MKFASTKTYGHEIGLSACFRQWRAESHCRFLHGYALSVKFEFHADRLDKNSWVVDFGSMKSLKEWLQQVFDHKLLVAHDDPGINELMQLTRLGLAEVVVIEATGCEAFAKIIFDYATTWLESHYDDRVRLHSVEVREHGANSAIYMRP